MMPFGAPTRQLISAAATTLLLLSGCTSANDTSQVAAGVDSTPVVTTAPLAVPVELSAPTPEIEAVVAPTAAVSTPEPTPSTTAATPLAETAAPTAVEPTPSATPLPVAAPTATPAPVPAPPTPNPVPAPPAASAEPAAPTASGGGAPITLGDFDVVNLLTGSTQNIADLAPSGQTMLWFWAPHWSTCNLEAPSVVQFARDNPQISIVGMGAGSAVNGDSLDGAYEFVRRHGADSAGMTMLYDVSFRAWRNFGVSTQPWVVLFDDAGTQIYSRPGRIDLDSVVIALDV